MLNIFFAQGRKSRRRQILFLKKKQFSVKRNIIKMRFFSALPVLVFSQEIRDFQQRQREIEGQNSAQNVISFKKLFITVIII